MALNFKNPFERGGALFRPEVVADRVTKARLVPEWMESNMQLDAPQGTHLYDKRGNYATTIQNNTGNAIVFLENALIPSFESANISYKGNQKGLNDLAKSAEIQAFARYTKKTAAELSAYHTIASKGGWKGEPGGVLWLDETTRELHAWGAQSKAGNTFDLDNILTQGEGKIIDSPMRAKLKQNLPGRLFALWHGHQVLVFRVAVPHHMMTTGHEEKQFGAIPFFLN